MKIAMTLTLDGLLRALRTQAHRMADEIELDGVQSPDQDSLKPTNAPRRGAARRRSEADDDSTFG